MKTLNILSLCGLLALASVASAFDREATLAKHKEECQLKLVLAMGLAAQKDSGKSQAELEKVAAKSKNPEIMAPMVKELFAQPELQGRTFTFYNFESCLISKATNKQPIAINLVSAPLKACESKHSEMESFIKCIDSTIINYEQKS
ncbi:hypothetical protein [Microbulbifer aestuariivivens]|uniref:hypothetical protein n=1 Tax=Microbulbifer aestuariivivens TaxID=1908308 RepID=UPI0031ED7C65